MSWRRTIRGQNERDSPLFRAARSPTIAILLLLDTVTRALGTPANDNFSDRLTISGLTNTVTGSNVNATREPGEPNHAGNSGGKSVWWTWTAPTNWVVELDTFDSSFNTALAVYTGGSVSDLVPVASGFGNTAGGVSFASVAGATYQIAVDGWGSVSGTVVVNLRALPPPPNDSFANGSVIIGMTNTVTGVNRGATREPGEPDHGDFSPVDRSVWWTWTAPANGTVTIDNIGSSFAALLAVYT